MPAFWYQLLITEQAGDRFSLEAAGCANTPFPDCACLKRKPGRFFLPVVCGELFNA